MVPAPVVVVVVFLSVFAFILQGRHYTHKFAGKVDSCVAAATQSVQYHKGFDEQLAALRTEYARLWKENQTAERFLADLIITNRNLSQELSWAQNDLAVVEARGYR